MPDDLSPGKITTADFLAMLRGATPEELRAIRWSLWGVLVIQRPTDFDVERSTTISPEPKS